MTKTELYLGFAGVAASAVVLYEVMTIVSPTHPQIQSSDAAATVQNSANNPPGPNTQHRDQSDQPVAGEFNADLVKEIIPPDGRPVPDQSLLRLSSVVNIANSVNAAPDKALWQEVLPIARQLSSGACDCAQRVWLTHFIEMGEYALNGDDQNYFATAQGLVALGRNDKQAQEQNHEHYEQVLK